MPIAEPKIHQQNKAVYRKKRKSYKKIDYGLLWGLRTAPKTAFACISFPDI